jgi:ring-1,2-phenylacetyl-CoA epoxidase subunit PaaD
LSVVTDPEIPVVSIVELGIVREVRWDPVDPALLVVGVTPTYSGCPATELIMSGIRDALAALGVTALHLETRLAPPWTTEWMSADALRKLREYGIAPPRSAGAAAPIDVSGLGPLKRRQPAVPCPRCGSERTELVAQFGSTACKAQYRCSDCLEPFDYFKPH